MEPAHPVESLRGRKGGSLAGRTVALGVDAARGAPGAVRIARELARLGADVHPLVNPSTSSWVPAVALEYATGHAPATWPTHASYDAVVLAPLGPALAQKLRLGVPDTAPLAAALGHLGRAPVLAAPSPGVDAAPLGALGVRIVEGFDAHGEPLPEQVAARVAGALSTSPLQGRKALVLAGGAFAPWDAMRVVGTRGDAPRARDVALALVARGAEVTLALGPSGAPHHEGEVAFTTLQELGGALAALGPFDLALVEDGFPSWAPAQASLGTKLPSGQGSLLLPLRPLPPIRGEVARQAARVLAFRGAGGASLDALVRQAEEVLA